MKSLKYLIFFLLCSFLLATPVFAQMEEDLKNFVDLDSILENLPEEIQEEEAKLFFKNDGEEIAPRIWEKLFSFFTLGIRENLSLLATLLALLLISAFFESIKKSFSPKTESAFDFLFLATAALFLFPALSHTVESIREALSSANAFLLSTAPVSTVLLTLSGAPSSAATQSAFLSFILALFSTILTYFLFPLIKGLFCFAVIEGVGEANCGGFLSYFQTLSKRLILFFFTVISATLAIRNALSAAADSVSMRSVRFAAGNFIPVVGTLVGENARLISGTFHLVKAECGITCITVLLLLLLRPILFVFVQKTFLFLVSATGKILGEKRLSSFLQSLFGIFDLLSALLITSSVFFIFVIGLFLQTKGGL